MKKPILILMMAFAVVMLSCSNDETDPTKDTVAPPPPVTGNNIRVTGVDIPSGGIELIPDYPTTTVGAVKVLNSTTAPAITITPHKSAGGTQENIAAVIGNSGFDRVGDITHASSIAEMLKNMVIIVKVEIAEGAKITSINVTDKIDERDHNGAYTITVTPETGEAKTYNCTLIVVAPA